ncbi:RNA 3'-terminal phosphate cyclase [Paludibaculum fermentans]|uniref:RNA 3'-terminal phosphate cyclase n=1 Tax=Paludibaculum fermentans TaxID=1473598 RepID=A0A7S7NYC6_PALFE|nr:RNA 3'-terminal phosphate cyclase [Paludibaculum fermentans]
MIQIDGSFGEGGGQILRTALSLSLVTGRPIQIDNIRAGRERPGLLRQHLTAVLAAAEIGQAQVEGAVLGSTSIGFVPGPVKAGEYRFAVGSAGSGTLVFQTVLPALMLATSPSKLVIEGGTHNDAAPPFPFLERAFLPLVERMGPRVQVRLERPGFYPAGGGRFTAEILPTVRLKPLHLGERAEMTGRRVVAIVANLPRDIAEREVKTAARLLEWGPETQVIESTRESAGPGNVVMVEVESRAVTEIFTAFGKVGVSAERVAKVAVLDARAYLGSKAAVGEHLADQLLLPMALAGSGSFTAVKLNRHAQTNMEVIRRFLPVRFECSEAGGHVAVAVRPE